MNAAVGDGAGGYYIGGQFTQVGGISRNSIAHILADGSVDPAFDPNASNYYTPTVNAIAVSGSTVYVGGAFYFIGGQDRTYIAALDASSRPCHGLEPARGRPSLRSRRLRLHCLRRRGLQHHRRAVPQPHRRSDASSGAATAWNPYADSTVSALDVEGSTVYAGGLFTSIGGQDRNYIAALDATSGAATAWDPHANSTVNSLAVSGSTVYVGGQFSSIGGQARNDIAALDATSGVATAWDASADGPVYTLAVAGSTVYVGGTFTLIGGASRTDRAALDATSGAATTWQANAASRVDVLAVSGSTVYAGGEFTSIGGQTRNLIAALDTSGVCTAWDPKAGRGLFNGVYALAVSGATVYAGGAFSTIGGESRQDIAALDAATGLATAWDPHAVGAVYALAVSGSTVYAAGGFSAIGGQTRNCIAALDATSGLATAWNPNASGSEVYGHDLAVSGSTVYAGGTFTRISGKDRNCLAALDVTNGAAAAWNPNASSTISDVPFVYALAVSGSTVYAGGYFTAIGGHVRNNLAALDASGNATSWDPNASGTVCALAVSGSTVYAGGYFTTIGGQTRKNIAALDASSGLATGWDASVSGTSYPSVLALAVSGPTVYAGGSFTSIGGQPRPFFARFSLDTTSGPPITSLAPAAGRIGSPVTISGSAFGTTQGSVTFAGLTAAVTSWSDTQVICAVPAGLAGVVPVVRDHSRCP